MHQPSATRTLNNITIHSSNVYDALTMLDSSQAMGIDNIGPGIHKHCALAIYVPLCHLFNLSLSSHTLPSEWCVHLIAHIHKSGDKTPVDNYRPVSLLCAVSKV